MNTLQPPRGQIKRGLRSDPPCPDLRQLCRGTYRLDHDPAADAGDTNPWMATLAGRYGVVYPHGRDTLAVETDDGRVAARLAEVLGDAPPYQHGENFWCYLFPAALLVGVAAVIKPPKERRLSARARQRLAAAGGGTQFGALCYGTQAPS
jgi:hypothetical protein